MIEYNIIGTGSKGNAVVINNNILIDAGVPFRALKGVYKDLALALLTHEHQDHALPRTIKRLAQERPTLRWGCCEWMVGTLLECGVSKAQIDVLALNTESDYGGFSVQPVPLVHNVPNCGWKVHFRSGERLFYATDTNSLDGIVAQGYDLYMVEANYTDEDIQERIRRKQEAGEYCYEWDVLENHLSKEKADAWLYKNMGANSSYVYLHGHEGEDIDASETT